MLNTIIVTASMMAWLKIARSRGLRNRFARAGESLPGRALAGFIIAMSGRRRLEICRSENLSQVGFPISFGTGCFCPNLLQEVFGGYVDPVFSYSLCC